ncbi:MAG: hypothetical protein O9267_14065 [Flavobacterium sp.]|uniref:hypothetical protein n=1 Tax=Flavobacterium sp. TaxID=239 RepID=UPI0022C6E97F|nr:hypothetical protein [Flavobacterium sp.]MCZ8198725.1 hypothetical protein [Flavobacterium sp.]
MKNFNLENEPKIETGFTIPENYFNDFSERVMQQLPSEKPKVISLYQSNKNWFLTAAAILIVSFTIPTFYLLQNNSNELNTSELESYILDHSTVSQDDIVDLLNENDLKEMNVDYNLEDISSEVIDLENIDLEQNL